MNRTAARRAAERRGRRAEIAALVFLCLKGYRPLARRVRTPHGEIDLIVRRGRTIVFVEVKSRAESAAAAMALSARQQQRIIRAAQWWLARQPHTGDLILRFDLISGAGLFPHRHVISAFEAP